MRWNLEHQIPPQESATAKKIVEQWALELQSIFQEEEFELLLPARYLLVRIMFFQYTPFGP